MLQKSSQSYAVGLLLYHRGVCDCEKCVCLKYVNLCLRCCTDGVVTAHKYSICYSYLCDKL